MFDVLCKTKLFAKFSRLIDLNEMKSGLVAFQPIPTQYSILMHLRYIAVENIERKGEISPFLTMFFLPYMVLNSHLKCTLKCRL